MNLRWFWMDPDGTVHRDSRTLVKIVVTLCVTAVAVTIYLALTMLSVTLDNKLFTDHALQTPLTYTVTPAPTAPKQADAAQPVNPPGTLPPYDVDSDPTMFHHMRPQP